ncbi:hypothetical protein FRX31_016884 [Thalictrum thalictroides]|uniref:Uncharacterized protein n=1 Tax=Thalictrum thalictroides TaxID=46969 RepID=A0A7J6W808_THATH|nr:hypothetical protein FRX31_016884 [Thalictrum thalictroides]
MSNQRQPGPRDPLSEAAGLLDRTTRLLRQATATSTGTTAARVRQLSTDQLRRDPALWAAYQKGWADCKATFQRAAQAVPTKPPGPHRSRSRDQHRPPTAATAQQPPRPLLPIAVRPPPAAPPAPLSNAAPAKTARQRRDRARLLQYQQQRKEAARATSTKPVPPPPAFSDMELATTPPPTTQPPSPTPTAATTSVTPIPKVQAPEAPAATGDASDPIDWEGMDVSLTPVAYDDIERLESTWWTASPSSTPASSPKHL